MKSLIAWLLGADPETFGGDAELSFRLNQSVEGWVVFVLAVAVIGFTIWVYRRDGRETASGLFRFFLGVLRVCLLAIGLLMLTEPVLLSTRTVVKKSTVLVMLDDSYSMNLGFPYAEEQLRAQVVAALGPDHEVTIRSESGELSKVAVSKLEPGQFGQITRMQVACQALRKGDTNFLDELKKRHPDLKLFLFSEGLNTGDDEAKSVKLSEEEDFTPVGKETRLGDCLRQAIKDLRGTPLAGVVVITDGRQNAGEDAVHVVSTQYKVQRIPVFTVGVGDPGEPKDIELTIEGPDVILPDDPTEVIAYVRQKGYESLGTVRLEMRRGDGSTVVSEDVKLGKSGEKVLVPLNFREAKAGKYVYSIHLPKQDGELRDDNNDATYKFEVVDKKVKVLFVEGQDLPRWEYRYLKNALIRDHTTEADVMLSTSDGNFIWDGTSGKDPLDAFPVKKKEINVYDVLIVGDVNPTIFTKKQIDLIRDFVREGGGFILIAGERYAPSHYASGPMSEMLPVVPQRAAYETPAEGFQEAWPMELTAAGKRMGWTHLDPDNLTNREIWENLPKLFWYYPVKKTKIGAETIAVHPYDKDEKGKKMPLVVTMPYGAGKTMYIGTDDMWRWRKGVGDRYHYRFYNQAIRYLSIAKRLGGQKRFLLGADKLSYAIGDRVILTALLKDEKFNPLKAERVNIYIKDPEGKSQTLELSRKGAFPGSYEGYFYPNVKGDYTMWLRDERQPEVHQSEITFRVDVPQLELENPRMNEELLRSIAAAGDEGGDYFSIDRLSEIPPLVEPKEEKVDREASLTIWDNWGVLLLFALLITLEWVLRKRGRMI